MTARVRRAPAASVLQPIALLRCGNRCTAAMLVALRCNRLHRGCGLLQRTALRCN